MSTAFWALIVLFAGHWLSDFVFQPDWMGKGKSSSWGILTEHASRILVGSYFTAFAVALFAGTADTERAFVGGIAFAAINAVAHFGIDAVTSRMTGRYYKADRHHAFFTTIGFDQFLHMAIAVTTLAWLVKT